MIAPLPADFETYGRSPEMADATIYKSECGGFLCRATRQWGNFEVFTADGSTHWRDDDRFKTFADERAALKALPYCTGGFSAQKTGQKKGSFTITILNCDAAKAIIPWTGNTVTEQRDVIFRRRVPKQNWPKFLRSASA